MKVAILQDSIGGGGRLAVIIEMIAVLNKHNITPDLLTFNMSITKEEMKQKYNRSINYNVKTISPNLFKKLPELNKICINIIANRYKDKYDFFIDSNNTACCLSKKMAILSYTYYPRIDRVFKYKSIHIPDYQKSAIKSKIVKFIDHLLAMPFYYFDKINNNNSIITLSEFSKSAIMNRYKIDGNHIKIIYPPVDVNPYNPNRQKENRVATLGRFSPYKRQFEQIKIAEKLPELEFCIMGFATETDPYYLKCKHYIDEHNIKNVQLYRSIDYKTMISILETSKYFLHTLINEPFGITTVQGIAAGCIPVVPDSGGQKEVVPVKELRFKNIDEAIQIFRKLRDKNEDKINKKLTEYIKRYDTQIFRNEFNSELEKFIGIL